MAKRKAKVAVPKKPSLPIVEQPGSGKREVVVEPPIRVRILANSKEGWVITAERSAATVNAGEPTDRQLDSASRDQTMYVVVIGDAKATLRADQIEVL